METIAKNAKISALILDRVGRGETLAEAIDAVLGAGSYAKIAGDLYDSLRR